MRKGIWEETELAKDRRYCEQAGQWGNPWKERDWTRMGNGWEGDGEKQCTVPWGWWSRVILTEGGGLDPGLSIRVWGLRPCLCHQLCENSAGHFTSLWVNFGDHCIIPQILFHSNLLYNSMEFLSALTHVWLYVKSAEYQPQKSVAENTKLRKQHNGRYWGVMKGRGKKAVF